MEASVGSDRSPHHLQAGAIGRLRLTLFLSTLILGFLRAWAARQMMDPDGTDYLDMADAYLRRDWHTALNGLWSPLYSWCLGAASLVFKPSAAWEFPMVHAVNATIFLVMLLCFDYFLRTWIEFQQSAPQEAASARFPAWAWLVLGYTLIIFTSLDWMTMEDVGPDHLVAASIFLASAFVLQMQRESVRGFWRPAILGAVLGLGYLAKAPMFPISVLFFVLLFTYLPPAADKRQIFVAIACFLALATPFITALSFSKGRLTIGDSGKLNYAWHVNRQPLAHWRGDPGQNVAKHPTRQINDDPAVYEFDGPIKATYPVSYDPSYWEEGLSPRFQLWQQLAAIKNNSIVLIKMLFQSAPSWIALAILLSAGSGLQPSKSDISFGFLVLSAAAVGMFLLVHLEPRYIAPFVVIAVLVLFGWLKLPDTDRSRALFSATTLALFALLCLFEVTKTYTEIQNAAIEGHEQLAVAKALNEMGLHSGDKVGNIGDSYIAYWARLARLSIISEVPQPESDRFWHSDALTQQKTLDSMIRAGAKIVITDYPAAHKTSWQNLKGTDHYFFKPQ